MKRAVQRALLAAAAIPAVVTVIVAVYLKLGQVNPTTVALTFLLAVLVVAATWGLSYAVAVAILAALAFNYFFLPPVGTFAISDPANWVALFVFLVTAIIASQLSERARRASTTADRRRREVERLYHFSQQLLVTESILALLREIPGMIVASFGVNAAVIFLSATEQTFHSDAAAAGGVNATELKAVAGRGEPLTDEARGLHLMPLRRGALTLGSIAVIGATVSRETLEAMGSLIATAIERAGAVEKLSKAEAARESEQLRSALLDSIAHEFRTPLTGIKAAVTSLISGTNLDAAQRGELLTVINEESDRLNGLIGEATEMAQLDAGQVQLEIEPHFIRAAIEAALRETAPVLATHPVELQVPSDLPAVRMDSKRITEVLKHLLDNAAKYSPPGSPIRISSVASDGSLKTSVADYGPGISEAEQSLIFHKFYRGRNQRCAIQGTGMGLAIARAIVEAHGGTMGVTSQSGRGSVFHFTLPLD